MHDISNNLSPPNIANLFMSKASIHSYKTRSSSRGDYCSWYLLYFFLSPEIAGNFNLRLLKKTSLAKLNCFSICLRTFARKSSNIDFFLKL